MPKVNEPQGVKKNKSTGAKPESKTSRKTKMDDKAAARA